jgi:hypothetical protein
LKYFDRTMMTSLPEPTTNQTDLPGLPPFIGDPPEPSNLPMTAPNANQTELPPSIGDTPEYMLYDPSPTSLAAQSSSQSSSSMTTTGNAGNDTDVGTNTLVSKEEEMQGWIEEEMRAKTNSTVVTNTTHVVSNNTTEGFDDSTPPPTDLLSEEEGMKDWIEEEIEARDANNTTGATNTTQVVSNATEGFVDSTSPPTDLLSEEEEMKDWIEEEMEEWSSKNETGATNTTTEETPLGGDDEGASDEDEGGDTDEAIDEEGDDGDEAIDEAITDDDSDHEVVEVNNYDASEDDDDQSAETLLDDDDGSIRPFGSPTRGPTSIPVWNAPTPAFTPELSSCSLTSYQDCNPYLLVGVAAMIPLLLICICRRWCCRGSSADDKGQYRQVAAQYGHSKYDNTFSDEYSADGSTGDIELSLAESNG